MPNGRHFAKALDGPVKKAGPKIRAGLAELPEGTDFRCPDCEYFKEGVCQFKEDPDVYLHRVTAKMCCNHFDNSDMEKISGW